MAGWPKNKQASPCFCNHDCPGPGRPYHKYLVGGIGTKFTDLNTELWLAQVSFNDDELCRWTFTDGPGGMTFTLDLASSTEVGWEHAYTWSSSVIQIPNSDNFVVEHTWNDADLPVTPTISPSCDASFDLLNSDIIPKTLRIEPVPDWVCDQDQARAWREGLS